MRMTGPRDDLLAALARAASGPCLEAAGDLIRTGPTGTNVMDLVNGLKIDEPTPPRATP
jgi:glycerate-2-kinase